MRLIDADALYEKTAEWEAQALHMVEVTMHDEDKTEWRRWSAVLTERSAFKYDISDAQTVQPELIACGDCKHYICHDRRCGYWNHGVKPLDWCSHAERMDS